MSNQKDKDNIFGGYDIAEQREAEQQQIEAEVTGQKPAVRKGGRPRKRKNATSITLVVSAEDKKMQDYAYDHAMTASDLLHKWISELPDG